MRAQKVPHAGFKTASTLLLCLAACKSYEPEPLDPAHEWSQLESVRLEDLVLKPEDNASNGKHVPPPFDYSDGLSPDEAAAVAIALNPDLRAFRVEKGIAEGELLSAGLLPNPEIDANAVNPAGPTSLAGEIDILFDLTEALVTRGPRKARARARIEEVRWEVADREWQIRNEVYPALLELSYVEETLKLNQSQRQVASRTLTSIKARKDGGTATELEVVVAEGEFAELRRQEQRLLGDKRLAQQRLNELLGLPPNHKTRLERTENPLAYASVSGSPESVASQLKTRRPDLLAAEQAYLVAEKELHVEFRRRFGRLWAGPRGQREGDGTRSWGFAFSLELPIFNWNQGEIAVKNAARMQRRREYVALLHGARAEFYAAWAQRETLDAELKLYFADIAPRLDRSMELAERAFKQGELDLLQVLLLQGRVLRAKQEVLARLRDFHRSRIEVERTLGPTRGSVKGK
ncbi:MAG: TolC family protein [Planctomycetota bacterium]|nr:TolC family protein [Planctomycetota bacterium]